MNLSAQDLLQLGSSHIKSASLGCESNEATLAKLRKGMDILREAERRLVGDIHTAEQMRDLVKNHLAIAEVLQSLEASPEPGRQPAGDPGP